MLAALLRSPPAASSGSSNLRRANPGGAVRWREAFDEGAGPAPHASAFSPCPRTSALDRPRGPRRLAADHARAHLIVQVEDALGPDAAQAVVRLVAQISRNVQRAELHDLGAAAERVRERQAVLIAQLRPMVHELVISRRASRHSRRDTGGARAIRRPALGQLAITSSVIGASCFGPESEIRSRAPP